MYLGLMRRGISFMGAFAGVIAAVAVGEWMLFNFIVPAIALLPLIWFISFFDFWRFQRMSASDRAQIKDDFLLIHSSEIDFKLPKLRANPKVYKWGGIALIVVGVDILSSFLFNMFRFGRLDALFLRHPNIEHLFYSRNQLLAALVIVLLGIFLIVGKSRQIKRQLRDAEQSAEQPPEPLFPADLIPETEGRYHPDEE
jgi:hypothetical protein